MGNALGGKRTAKVMKIDGETFKFKTPVKAGDVAADHPGHVLLESEAVKHYGIRAKPLEAHQDLVPKRLYFLVELPNTFAEKVPRRVRSGIHMRDQPSDLSIMKPASIASEAKTWRAEGEDEITEGGGGEVQVAAVIALVKLHRIVKGGGLPQQVNWKRGHGRVGNEGITKAREKRVSFLPFNEAEMQIAVASY
uniref:Uncharacterized protein n=1 Tax=Salix viminalis TaxID=40686 RepID=A0A6N2N7R0_SALVM